MKSIISQHCLSAGDALREVYSQSIIESDFILVTRDVISNMNLAKVMQAHKYALIFLFNIPSFNIFFRERREKDKSNIMTMVFKQSGPTHRSR